ncbi:putative glycosyltransferase EpsE [Bacillus sp. J14TS2]|uniref:glycosyltransferase n=1 Tax=Bacillus sp. J14TS2 TaxID=2807188 RepID=UPI001B0A718D|nr:glycosyltransferase [Bacillus sp. J14TS2]GIN73227.1 putative glycosyltransferase EpsE [Bacillus sp. J14TS2]
MPNDHPKVSVIMGIYNCAETLPQSIESILHQTYTDWEFIICDDGSTDHSYEIAERYATLYPNRIKLLKNEKNLKLAATLNHCLKVVQGEYIARQDGDDLSVPERLEKQVAFLDQHPDYMLVGAGMIPFDEHGERVVRIGKLEPQKEDLPMNQSFMHATIMMRKEGYEQLNGYSVTKRTRRAEDYELWIRFFAAGYRGYNLQEALYKVKEDRNALKRRKFNYSLDHAFLILRGCYRLKLPLKYYVYIFKPIIVGAAPRFIVKRYYQHRDEKYIRSRNIKEQL